MRGGGEKVYEAIFTEFDEKEPEMKSVDDMEYKYVPVSTN